MSSIDESENDFLRKYCSTESVTDVNKQHQTSVELVSLKSE